MSAPAEPDSVWNRSGISSSAGPTGSGTSIMTLPALRSIRITCPEAHIAVLVKPWVADILRACPDVDEIILYQRPGAHEGLAGLLKLAGELRTAGSTAPSCFRTRSRRPLSHGLPNPDPGRLQLGRQGPPSHPLRSRNEAIRQVHQTRYYTAMLESLGFSPSGTDAAFSWEQRAKRLGRSSPGKFRLDSGQLARSGWRRAQNTARPSDGPPKDSGSRSRC